MGDVPPPEGVVRPPPHPGCVPGGKLEEEAGTTRGLPATVQGVFGTPWLWLWLWLLQHMGTRTLRQWLHVLRMPHISCDALPDKIFRGKWSLGLIELPVSDSELTREHRSQRIARRRL